MEETKIRIQTTIPIENELQQVLEEIQKAKVEISIDKLTKRSIEQLSITIFGVIVGALISKLVDQVVDKIVKPNPFISSITVIHFEQNTRVQFNLPDDKNDFSKHFDKILNK